MCTEGETILAPSYLVILAPPELLVTLAAPWAHFYGDSAVAATVVTFLHIAPLVVGGGVAISLDRKTLQLRSNEHDRCARHLAELGSTHRLVMGALALTFASGVALLAADLETFWGSWIFWLKMGLVALLLVNGSRMNRLERALATPRGDADPRWRLLRQVAIASLVLWLATTFAGVALQNLG